jgi:DNA-binding beta-propeller fold protein YncE
MMSRRRAFVPLVLLAVSGVTAAARAQGQAEGSSWFRVDPSWPRHVSDLAPGEVPGIAVDKSDRIYVLARANPPVRVYTADGKFLRAWGEGQVDWGHGIRVDQAGYVWVTDIGRHVVYKFTPDGKLELTLGTPDESGADEKHLNQPTDVAIAPDGHVFATDGYGNHRIVHFDPKGQFLGSWGKADARPGRQAGEFHTPHAIVIDSEGRLYVADRGNGRIQVFDRSGTFLDAWTNVMVPWGLWISPKDEIWACGSTPMPHNLIEVAHGIPPKDQVFVRFDTTGRIRQLWGVPRSPEHEPIPGTSNWVHGLAVDSKGNLYAGEIQGQRAQKFVRRP